MGVLVAVTTGLVVWIVLWAIDVKAFDAFLIVIALALVAVLAARMRSALPGRQDDEPGAG